MLKHSEPGPRKDSAGHAAGPAAAAASPLEADHDAVFAAAGAAPGPDPAEVQLRPSAERTAPVMAHWADAGGPPPGGGGVHAAARSGTAEQGGALPHADAIGRAFGRHDVSAVRAHTGGAAAAATAALGARAYASGSDIAFAPGGADLHTTAHEAAHVVQQRGGVQLPGGVGQAGDAHERQADAVADAVVAGRSAEALLEGGGGGGGGRAVQRIEEGDLKARGERVAALAETAPTTGMNLWEATCQQPPATLFLLGTEHYTRLSETAFARPIISFLESESFSHVFTELPFQGPKVTMKADLADKLEKKAKLKRAFDAKHGGAEPVRGEGEATKEYGQRVRGFRNDREAVDQADVALGGMDLTLDDAYVVLAGGKGGVKKDPQPAGGSLETTDTRQAASAQNVHDLNIDEGSDQSRRKHRRATDEVTTSEDVKAGDQRTLFGGVAQDMLAGRDIANQEERNRQWVDRLKLPEHLQEGDRQLWIVGAGHLPGLILRLQDLGWKVGHRGPLPARD